MSVVDKIMERGMSLFTCRKCRKLNVSEADLLKEIERQKKRAGRYKRDLAAMRIERVSSDVGLIKANEELAALKERHAADVEAAFKEGLNTGRSPFNLLDSDAVFGHRQWKESRAKQALAESEGE